MFFRLVITNQKTPVFTTNPDEFNLCAGVSLFRVNQSYPIAAGKLSLKSLSNANLSTNDGSFTWNLSACVSSKKKMEPGTYVIVASTFDPGVQADFQLMFYSQFSV